MAEICINHGNKKYAYIISVAEIIWKTQKQMTANMKMDPREISLSLVCYKCMAAVTCSHRRWNKS
jgi:hypothetical protein